MKHNINKIEGEEMGKKLEEIYKLMKIELIETTVENIIVSGEKKNIEYSPEYQRNYIWKETKATNLIETVLMKGIVPPLTVIKKGKQMTIVDGRQRYETLLRFYNNQFNLKDSGLQKLKDWENRSYNELAPNLRELFKDYKVKLISYTVQNFINITNEDLDRLGRDLFRRLNSGITSLKEREIARAQYCYDKLTNKFEQLFKTDKEIYDKCIELFFSKAAKKLDQREKMNFLLITVRELITMFYMPIIGEKNIQFSIKVVNKYYDEFVRKLIDKEQLEKVKEFQKIFEKLYLINEKLIQENSDLQNNIGFFKSTYWMFSLLYSIFPNEFYDFNIDKFCHYIEAENQDYFDIYNGKSGTDTEKRNTYMKIYIEKELKLDISNYVKKTKQNKKTTFYIKDSEIDSDKEWYSTYLSQSLITIKETMEVKEIIKKMKKNEFVVRSHYQRGEVLDRAKASRVIESIILGAKLPPIYLYTEGRPNGYSSYVVLDGQQRIINLLKYMGERITVEDYDDVKTYKDKYALQDLLELDSLNGKTFENIGKTEREIIEDYVFDVIRIDKRGNENIDFVDIFIRLNQNPCSIDINSFQMWNSFEITKTISRIKEIAKYKAFKQCERTMQEEELVTILAYMHYRNINIKNIDNFLRINLCTDNKNTKKEKNHIKIRIKEKKEITKFLETIVPNSETENEFLKSVNAVNDFVDKLKILSNNNEKVLINIFSPNESKQIKRDKNCFYIMWLILQELDTHIIETYKEEILQNFKETFKLMRNMPNDKSEQDFIDYVKDIICQYSK